MGRRSDDLEVRRHKVETGYTREGHVPYATIKEFFALVGTGATHQEATENLRAKYRERIRHMTEQGFKIPVPGAQPESPRFASNDQVEALRPFADRFWSEVLGTPYSFGLHHRHW